MDFCGLKAPVPPLTLLKLSKQHASSRWIGVNRLVLDLSNDCWSRRVAAFAALGQPWWQHSRGEENGSGKQMGDGRHLSKNKGTVMPAFGIWSGLLFCSGYLRFLLEFEPYIL